MKAMYFHITVLLELGFLAFSSTALPLSSVKGANKPEGAQKAYRLKLAANLVNGTNVPRCGVIDTEEFTTLGSVFENKDLTYRIQSYTSDLPMNVVDTTIKEAFQYWADVTPLTFTQTASSADIEIKFTFRDHGDGAPFDGPSGVLAHAFNPGPGIGGDAHFDESEEWSATNEGINLLIVATHEFGHSLGLGHTNVTGSVMLPEYQFVPKENFNLSKDDTDGIQSLYGAAGDTTQALSQTSTQAPSQTATQSPSQTATQSPSQTSTQSPSQTSTQAPSQTSTQAPSQTSTQSPSQTSTQAPSQNSTQVPSQTSTQAPSQTSTQAPSQTATQSPSQTSTQSPSQTSTQSPSQTSTQAPSQTSTQSPSQTSTQAPSQNSTQVPSQTSTQAPSQTSTQAPSQTATQSPSQTSTQSPSQTSTQSPSQTSTQAPSQTSTQSPSQTSTQAPSQNSTQSPSQTSTQAPSQTSTQSPSQTSTQSPSQTSTQAPSQTSTQSPSQTSTQAPSQNSTQVPSQTSTQAPSQTSTQAPSQTATQSPSQTSTQSPSQTSTQSPSQTSTQAPSQTSTQAPSQTSTQAPSQTSTQAPSQTSTQATIQTSTQKPAACDPDLFADAAFRSRRPMLFKNGFYRIGRSGRAIPVINTWPSMVSNIDAAISYRRRFRIIFFSGSQYWVYNKNVLRSGYPKPITDFGLPSSVTKIDAAMQVRYRRIVFFVGNQFWIYSRSRRSSWGPYLISNTFNNISKVDAALHQRGNFYLISGPLVYKYRGTQFIRSFRPNGWMNCN